MAQFEQHFVQDLTQQIKVRHCGSIVFNADNESNVVSVRLFNGSEPVAISGSVVGAVVCSDGSTVPLTGSYSGNTASITLTGDCFAVLGQIGVGIQIVNGTQKTTVLKVIYNVETLTTENVVDPGSRITLEVGDLIAAIDEAVATIPEDYSALTSEVEDIKAVNKIFNRDVVGVPNPIDTATWIDNANLNDSGATKAAQDWKVTEGYIETSADSYKISYNNSETLYIVQVAGYTSNGSFVRMFANADSSSGVRSFTIDTTSVDKIRIATRYGNPILSVYPNDGKIVEKLASVEDDVGDLKSKIGGVLDIETTPSKNLNKTPYPDSYTTKGVTFTKNEDGSITMSGSPTGDIYWPLPIADEKWLLPAGTYTIAGGYAQRAVTLNLYANKDDTSSTVQKSSGANSTTFTTEQDYWAWLRFDVVSTAVTDGVTLYPQIEAGTQATEYQSPDAVSYSSTVLDGLEYEMTELTSDVDGLNDSVNDLGDEVNGLSTTVSGITEVVVGKNKVDPSKLVTGHIQSDGTVAANGAYAIYSTSEYIPLTANTDYVFSAYNSSGNLRTGETVVCALFDESKNVIANSYQSVSGTGYLTFNSGSTAKFARVTTKTSGSYFQLELGRTTPSAYEAYTAHDVIALPLGDVPTEQVQKQIDDAINNSGVIQFEVGKNLVDPAKRVTGYIQSNGSISAADAYASYSTSDYIELEQNTDYVFAGFGESTHGLIDYNRVACLLFDESKTRITGTYQDLSSSTAHGVLTFNSGTNAKYARVTTKTNAIFQLEKGTTPTRLEEYRGQYVVGYPLGNTPFTQSQTGNILFGKKWAVCGDSFTDGATDGRIADDGIYKGARYVYPYLIGNRNYMKIEKFFNGGETLAFPAEPGTFTNSLTNPNGERYYQNIPADSDYITIYLGINDRNHATGSSQDGESTEGLIPLGEINDSTTATYYGAWNVVLTWLITNRPHAHIGIIVCNGISSTDTYRQAQIAIAKKYGLPYMDLNGDARTPSMHRTCNPDIADAVKTALLDKWSVSSSNSHPNDAAHLFESMFIENFLRGI